MWVQSDSQARQNKIIYFPNMDNQLTGVNTMQREIDNVNFVDYTFVILAVIYV
jgi:hypothetical protein